jgi:hypothetical protein
VKRFFIYSTPRSGSAWLSNFLTYGGSFCQHEPLADGRMEFTDHPVSGAIDTGAALVGYLPPANTEVYHLWRNPLDVGISLRRMGLQAYNMCAYKRGFEYNKLFNKFYIRDLWDRVTGLPYDEARAEMLIEMNVQRDLAAVAGRMARRA